jgi:hypothetical protein
LDDILNVDLSARDQRDCQLLRAGYAARPDPRRSASRLAHRIPHPASSWARRFLEGASWRCFPRRAHVAAQRPLRYLCISQLSRAGLGGMVTFLL